MACAGLAGGAARGFGTMSMQTGEPQPWQISWNDTAWTASELFQARHTLHTFHTRMRSGVRQAAACLPPAHAAPLFSASCMHSRASMVSIL